MKKILFVEYCAKDVLDGTCNMDCMAELAYRRIIDMIYSTNDQLLDNDSLKYTTKTGRKWKKIRHDLIHVYKKIYIEDGYIRNQKCTFQMQKACKNIAQKTRAGKCSFEVRKSLKNNKTDSTAVGTAVATAVPTNQEPNIEYTNVYSPPISPQNRFEEFWELYPRARRGNKQKAWQAYIRSIRENRATEEEIIHGVQKYRVSDEVDRGYAKGAAAWLNDDRWSSDYDSGVKPARGENQEQKSSYFDTLHAASRKAQASRVGENGIWDAPSVGEAKSYGARNGDSGIPQPPSASGHNPAALDPAGYAQTFEGQREPKSLSVGGLHRTPKGGNGIADF